MFMCVNILRVAWKLKTLKKKHVCLTLSVNFVSTIIDAALYPTKLTDNKLFHSFALVNKSGNVLLYNLLYLL